jgi:hypothetical protein
LVASGRGVGGLGGTSNSAWPALDLSDVAGGMAWLRQVAWSGDSRPAGRMAVTENGAVHHLLEYPENGHDPHE